MLNLACQLFVPTLQMVLSGAVVLSHSQNSTRLDWGANNGRLDARDGVDGQGDESGDATSFITRCVASTVPNTDMTGFALAFSLTNAM